MMSLAHAAFDADGLGSPRKRLLVVEDEFIVALDLSNTLEDVGYTVVGTASSSDEAIAAVELQRPDLVLMDVHIAGSTDGIQAAGLLRSRYGVPVVYLTANADAATLDRALATAPSGYLLKPYNQRSLQAAIEVAFRRHHAEQVLREAHHREVARFEVEADAARRTAEKLQREAVIDPLTGLYNRRHLEATMVGELNFAARAGHPVGIILIDLDHFKRLNDRFGHAAGDAALRAIGELMRARLRSYDTACRYGGEELVVLVPGADAAGAAVLAEELRAGIEQLAIVSAGVVLPPVTASLGVASFPDDGVKAEAVLQAADIALYRAKAGGRNQVIVAERR